MIFKEPNLPSEDVRVAHPDGKALVMPICHAGNMNRYYPHHLKNIQKKHSNKELRQKENKYMLNSDKQMNRFPMLHYKRKRMKKRMCRSLVNRKMEVAKASEDGKKS